MQSFSSGLPDPRNGAYLLMNDHVETSPGFKMSIPRSPSAYKFSLMQSPVSHSCQPGNVSATAACLKEDEGTIKTRLYIVFNHRKDQAARRCYQDLKNLFDMLGQVPYEPPAMDGSPKVIADDLQSCLIEFGHTIHCKKT
jgi:hypothetical protein